MDQDRRDAAAWAKEWHIRNKNRRLFFVLAAILVVVLIGVAIHYIIIFAERSTFSSEEEMRAAMQGRYAIERSYEDFIIEGDDIVHTYLSYSHYNRDYAERYGYDSEEDAAYEDRIAEWDYRHGVIKTQWMGDIIVDKNGNIHRSDLPEYIYYKTDEPRPDPIDPSTLNSTDGDIDASADDLAEDAEDILQREESLEETQDAASEAGTEAQDSLDDEDGEAV